MYKGWFKDNERHGRGSYIRTIPPVDSFEGANGHHSMHSSHRDISMWMQYNGQDFQYQYQTQFEVVEGEWTLGEYMTD